MPTTKRIANHPHKPERREDEDYVDYLGRCSEVWTQTPPPAPEGFELVPCDAEPRHWPVYTVIDDDFYPAGCPHCYGTAQSELLAAARCKAECRRRQTWRITRRFARWAYSVGLISGSGTSYNGCANHPIRTTLKWRGKRPYILGLRRESWRCFLKYHHIPSEHVGLGFCGKCLPCPTCGSTTAGHEPTCAEVS